MASYVIKECPHCKQNAKLYVTWIDQGQCDRCLKTSRVTMKEQDGLQNDRGQWAMSRLFDPPTRFDRKDPTDDSE